MLVRLLADRIAEAAAEYLHELVRKEVWGYANAQMETRTVDIHIAKLRKKIEPDPQQPQYITTVRGQGYRIGHVTQSGQ